MTTKQIVHLEECEPEQHDGWQKTTYRDALDRDAELREDTLYMANELYPEEGVWVESVPDRTAADLPEGSVVATATAVYIRRELDEPTLPWRGTTDGVYTNYHDNEGVDGLLRSGEATVLRVGSGL